MKRYICDICDSEFTHGIKDGRFQKDVDLQILKHNYRSASPKQHSLPYHVEVKFEGLSRQGNDLCGKCMYLIFKEIK